MNADPTKAMYDELYRSLATSTETQRKAWVERINSPEIDLNELLVLATEEKEIASRFFWLMGGFAELFPQKLFAVLPAFFKLKNNFKHNDWNRSFAKFWNLCGIPQENEAAATDLLFQWLISSKSNVSVKTYSLLALNKLAEKYPELKNELKLCVEDQLDKTSISFAVTARKIFPELL